MSRATWHVEGCAFAEYRLARAFAARLAATFGRAIVIMQDNGRGLSSFMLEKVAA